MRLFPPSVPVSKRLFDLLSAGLALLILSPLLLLLSLLIWVTMGRPVLFRQKRPGLNGHPFINLKYRTMTDARDGQGNLLPDEHRVTALGKTLRNSSLDELPELLNVWLGEMSLVGPRPLLMQYLDRYTPEQMRRHEVLPGMTGWAQIHGRNALSWEERFELDVWYVDHWTFSLDLRILAVTVWKVIQREGISQPGMVGSEEFLGSNHPKQEECA